MKYIKLFENSINKKYILYHGTTNNFTDFHLHSFGLNDSGWLGYGIYLTNDYEYAKSYSEPNGYVLKCEVILNNPFVLTDFKYSTTPDKLNNEMGSIKSFETTKKLQKMGYD